MNVNLTTGLTAGDEAAGDTFVGIENLVGSNAADLLAGTGVANFPDGRDGNDRLFDFAGEDALIGGLEADTMIGGSEADSFFFSRTDESPTGCSPAT